MVQTLNHAFSPLEQARRRQGLVINRELAQQLSRRDQALLRGILIGKNDYVANPVFEQADAQRKLFTEAPRIDQPDTSWYHPVMMETTPGTIKSKTVRTVLLTAAQERVLFLQFNYCRYCVAQLREQIGDESTVEPEDARVILQWYRRGQALRDQIAQTNLALVLAMAKRTRMVDVDFPDLVSEGNMALLRAADKFDVSRGFKFSTYACRAILKAFSRSGMSLSRYRQFFPTDFDPKLEKSDYLHLKRLAHVDDCVDEVSQIIGENRAELTEVEQSVIQHRFALGGQRDPQAETRPMTLEQVGRIIGVTKERVRQIQNRALVKIRQSLETGYLS